MKTAACLKRTNELRYKEMQNNNGTLFEMTVMCKATLKYHKAN